MSEKESVEATDAGEEQEGGFLGRFSKSFGSLLFEEEGSETNTRSTPVPRTSVAAKPVRSTSAVATPPTAPIAGPAINMELVHKMMDYMETELLKENPALKLFMESYETLESVIVDPKLRIKSAVALLAKKGGTTADLQLSFTSSRAKLQAILQSARDRRDQAKAAIQKRQDGVLLQFQQEEQQLNQTVEHLVQELRAAQDALAQLPGRRNEATQQFVPELQQLDTDHASVETAHQRVSTELANIEQNLA